jgi:2-hydroxy-6-oxonona-2,4-dienedioate hydrolase
MEKRALLMHFAYVDGVSTRYLAAGPRDAPVLLLVHGLTLTCDIWSEFIPRIAGRFRVVAPDMLGHGFTKPVCSPRQVDISAKARHLARFVHSVTGATSFAVSGSSYGALVACNMYLHEPSSVSHLALFGSGSCFNDEPQLLSAVARAHSSYAQLLDASDVNGWREHLSGSVFARHSIPVHLPHILALAYAQPWIADYWRATIAAMSDPERFRPFRVLERLEQIRAKTLLVWGRNDPGAPLTVAQAALERLPNASLEVLENCGHFPMFEHPIAASDAVSHFLLR